MPLPVFTDQLIFINPKIEENTPQSAIKFLCNKLQEKGYVNNGYFEEVIKREKVHPTGLPTMPYASAVPHADPIGVVSTGIALAILKEPVVFHAMDNPRRELDVTLIFLMSFNKGDQISMLQWISKILGNYELVANIGNSKRPKQVYKTIQPYLN